MHNQAKLSIFTSGSLRKQNKLEAIYVENKKNKKQKTPWTDCIYM